MDAAPPAPPSHPVLAGLARAIAGAALLGGAVALAQRRDLPAAAVAARIAAALAGAWLFGTGIHRALWASRLGGWGFPARVRPWASAAVALLTWVLLSGAAGALSAYLRGR